MEIRQAIHIGRPQIDSLGGFNLPDSFYKEYDKYEEAVEAALKYCLENLI